MFDSVKQLDKSGKGILRRRFLIAVVAGVGGYFGYHWWLRQPMALVERGIRFVTPNRDFYRVSISSRFPEKVDPQGWKLEIAGVDGTRRGLGLDDLNGLGARRIFKTFMCIETPVGGDSIGNAEWTGTPLGPVLEPLLGGAREGLRVAFRAMDGFYSSVPLSVALDPEAYLAWEMNGVPLPREHGYPLRVLLPGKYGMKQPRWLSRIEITADAVRGYWENRGWSDECEVKTMSRIDSAKPAGEGRWRVAGIAYCGGRPVGGVELSDDEGRTWAPGRLTSEALPNAWSTWEYDWTPSRKGDLILTVRATDAAGNRQIEEYGGSFPSGSTGLHRVRFTVPNT